MKLIIYIVLFVLLIIYINRQSRFLEERFSNMLYDNIDAIRPYEVLDTRKLQSVMYDARDKLVPAYDIKDREYQEKYWEIKPDGFSDMFNYEDLGSNLIFKKVNWDKPDALLPIPPVEQEPTLTVPQSEQVAEAFAQAEFVSAKPEEELKKVDLPTGMKYNDLDYYLIGSASNEYYNQYYLLYQNFVQPKNDPVFLANDFTSFEDTLYRYLLVKLKDGKPIILHSTGPRRKIEINDVFYLSQSSFQLGPLVARKLQ